MAAGMVLSVAQTLLAALQFPEVKEICAMFGYNSQLEKLQDSVTTIRAVLLDADAKEEQLSNEGRVWVDKLKHAVYDADDLFDEFITMTKRAEQMVGCKFSKKVLRFLSKKNQLLFAFNMSKDIKKIRKKLNAIGDDHSKFGLSVISQPRKKREETWSFVCEHSIIGRDADKEVIGDMLLGESGPQAKYPFVSIVGMGGLGKTTLAQLVYNDCRIASAFELRLWVCVSEDFGVKEILNKMLKSIQMHGVDERTIDGLQASVRQQIEGKKFFLVLDDVWCENRQEWVKLKEFLTIGAKGSKILVTTRSKKVAGAIGEDPMYEVPGLSNESSWLLFKNMAFKEGQEEAEPDLVEIGKAIFEKCGNVPLAIRVIGGILYGQDEQMAIS